MFVFFGIFYILSIEGVNSLARTIHAHTLTVAGAKFKNTRKKSTMQRKNPGNRVTIVSLEPNAK